MIALGLGGERRGVGEAVSTDVDDHLDAAGLGHGGPAVTEGEAFGELQGNAFTGRTADEDAIDLAGE